MYKRFCIQVFSLIILLLIIIGTINVIVDPFFQYHKPFMNIEIKDELYQNPGILKNFDYDAVITGSSMTENFKVSWFENEIPSEKVVKVPYSGAYSKECEIVFDLAFHNQDIKTIYYGIDIFYIFKEDSEKVRYPLPKYLYDNNPFNDVNYLFNKDVFNKYTLYNIKNNLLNEKKDNDLAYNWNRKIYIQC